MPKIRSDKISLLDVFSELSPQVMSNGQIRMECPFRENHSDDSGKKSFFVTPDINAYHCFSCRAHGNLVRLLTTRFRVNYFEAIGMVKLTDYHREKKEFDLDIMWNIDTPPEEFTRRGYTKECLRHFKVGTTDSGSMVIPYYDSFTLPKELLGYQERWYLGDERRVRNSKGFDKKSYLYNLDYSKEYVILVEGQSDVWRLFQHGYNACALMGLTISEEQVGKLSKFKKVYLALDNDNAGRRGVEVCNFLLKNHTEIMLIPYDTKDPGECKSKDDWDYFMGQSTDYVVYSMEMSMNWDGYLDMRDEVLRDIKSKT